MVIGANPEKKYHSMTILKRKKNKKNVFFSCVPFCLESLEHSERCDSFNHILTFKSLIVGSNGSKAMQVCLNENIGEFIFKLEENQEDIEDGGSSFTICIFNLLETLDKIFPDDENLVYSEYLKKVAEYHSSGKDKVQRNIKLWKSD